MKLKQKAKFKLTEAQKHELKKGLLLEREDSVSFKDFCNCDEIVSDDELEAKLDEIEIDGTTTFV